MTFCPACGSVVAPGKDCRGCANKELKKSRALLQSSPRTIDDMLRENTRTAAILKECGIKENINEYYADAVKTFTWGKLYDEDAVVLTEMVVHPALLLRLMEQTSKTSKRGFQYRGVEVERDRILSTRFGDSLGKYYIKFGENYDIERVIRGYEDGIRNHRYPEIPLNPLARFVLVPGDFGLSK